MSDNPYLEWITNNLDPITHADWCRLSQVFVAGHKAFDWQDGRINAFLKAMIREAEEGRPDPRTEYARLVLETTQNMFKNSKDRIATLEAQLAEARKDSERLEWLLKQGASVYGSFDGTGFMVYSSMGVEISDFASDSPREAIDAAIEAAGKESGE